VVASAAVVAVWISGALPKSGSSQFVIAAAAAVIVTSLLGAVWASQSLKVYGRVALSGTTNEEELLQALGEVRRFPRTLLYQAIFFWVASVLALAVYGRVALGMEGFAMRRLFLIGAAFGALASTWVFFPVTRRSREMLELLASALPLNRVMATARGGRQQLRGVLVAFTMAAVLLPSVLLLDMVRTDSELAAQEIGATRLGPERESVALALRTEITRRALVVTSLMVIFALLMARQAGRTLAEPLRRLADEANRLSRGELGPPKFIAAEAETWAVTSGFTLMQARLYDAVQQLQGAGQRIGVTTDRLLGTSARYESGAAEQAASLNETSATTEELAQSARQISQNATAVTQIAEKTLGAVRAGQQAAEDFARAVERMKHDNRAITDAVVRLQKRVQQIGRIVEFINTVADRSDLLALSAELEGTKAGEVGRGFTLVASEMRRLAENVIESTNEIEELITEIRDATRATVSATEEGLARTEGGMALAGDVTRSLDTVVDMARRTSEAVRAITLATQQQQTGTDQLAEAMADILGITQQGLAATRQLTSANQDLMGLAKDLHGLVGHFKVEREGRA
jgi:methyl-accepting chemotaxis protein